MNNWKIKQIGEIAKSGVGYHTITNNSLKVGMIDIWFGKYQSIETPEEALKVAKLVEKAPEMLELIQDLTENLEFQLSRIGYCGPGDHKDKKSDNDTYGGHDLLQRASDLIKEVTV